MKQCSKCKIDKPLDDYHVDKRSGKPRSYCKDCQRQLNVEWRAKNRDKVREQNRGYQLKHKLKTRYNLSDAEYQAAVEAASGKCAICREPAKLFIDHCHEREEFRGLLCTRCNTGLGMFRDNAEFLQRAIEYITPS